LGKKSVPDFLTYAEEEDSEIPLSGGKHVPDFLTYANEGDSEEESEEDSEGESEEDSEEDSEEELEEDSEEEKVAYEAELLGAEAKEKVERMMMQQVEEEEELPEKFLQKYRFRGKTINAIWAEAEKGVMTNKEKEDLYEFIRNARDLRSLQLRLYGMIEANKREREVVRGHLRQKKMKARIDWLKYDVSRGLIPVGEDSQPSFQELVWASAWFYPAPGEQGVYKGSLLAQKGDVIPYGLDAEDNLYALEIGFPSDAIVCLAAGTWVGQKLGAGKNLWRCPVGKVSNSKHNLPTFNPDRKETLLFARDPLAGAGGERALLVGGGGQISLQIPSQDRSDPESFYPRWHHCGSFIAAVSRGGLEGGVSLETGVAEAVATQAEKSVPLTLDLLVGGNVISSSLLEEGSLCQAFDGGLVVAGSQSSRVFRWEEGVLKVADLPAPYLATAAKEWLVAEPGILYREVNQKGRCKAELQSVVSLGNRLMVRKGLAPGPYGRVLEVVDGPK